MGGVVRAHHSDPLPSEISRDTTAYRLTQEVTDLLQGLKLPERLPLPPAPLGELRQQSYSTPLVERHQ